MPSKISRIAAIDAGASADIGAVADAAVTNPASSASIIAALKGIIKQLQGDGSGAGDIKIVDIEGISTIAGQKAMAASLPVVVASDQSNMPAEIKGCRLRTTQISTDQTITFANSDPANTQKTNTLTKPDIPIEKYILDVYNPSTVTDLTIKLFSVQTSLGGGTRNSYLSGATLSVPKSQTISGTAIDTYSFLLTGIFNGINLLLVFSNDTVLGGADGFSAYFRLRELI